MWSEIEKRYKLPRGEWIDWNQFGQDVATFFCNVGTADFLWGWWEWIIFRNGALFVSAPKERKKKDVEEPEPKKKKKVEEAVPEQPASTVPNQEENEAGVLVVTHP